MKFLGILCLVFFYRNIVNVYVWKNDFENVYKVVMDVYEIRKDILGDYFDIVRSVF